MLIGNVVGLVMLVVSVMATGGVLHLVGISNDTALAVIGSAMMALLDVAYRGYRGSTAFGRAGGRLFFLPVWLFGAVMTVATIVRAVAG